MLQKNKRIATSSRLTYRRLRTLAFPLTLSVLLSACSTAAIVDSAKSFGRSVTETALSTSSVVTDTAKEKVAVVAEAATLKPITPEQEAQIGLNAAATLLGAAPLVRDDELQKYVNRVGRWVAVQTGRSDINWRFGVLDTTNINAFAAPSGYVFITLGLFNQLKNEAELAGALGHEIAHVTRRHHAIAIAKKDRLGSIANLAADTVGVVASAIGNLVKGVYAAGLDKGDEYEADRLGVVYAARAGYDPYGLPRVLHMIAELPTDAGLELLFATHPAPADRLASLDQAMADKLIKLEASGTDNTSVFKRLLAASPEQRKSTLPPVLFIKKSPPTVPADSPAPETPATTN